MLTLEALREYGANTAEGMARCLNNEAFYLRLVGMALDDANFGRLREAIAEGDAKKAFEAAHALKGSIGNLALTPLYDPISALTERLRGCGSIDAAGDLPDAIWSSLEKARALKA
ncbi:MAG: Hpt domain-containing protein [Clostridia bacterium]|nr:Hpt domain-containing protein [Clostridia bacterium]